MNKIQRVKSHIRTDLKEWKEIENMAKKGAKEDRYLLKSL